MYDGDIFSFLSLPSQWKCFIYFLTHEWRRRCQPILLSLKYVCLLLVKDWQFSLSHTFTYRSRQTHSSYSTFALVMSHEYRNDVYITLTLTVSHLQSESIFFWPWTDPMILIHHFHHLFTFYLFPSLSSACASHFSLFLFLLSILFNQSIFSLSCLWLIICCKISSRISWVQWVRWTRSLV